MRDIYQEFEEVCFEISKINDISSTILDAMKNCLTENKSTYHLLTNLEMLNEKTCFLCKRTESLSYKILDKFQSKIL